MASLSFVAAVSSGVAASQVVMDWLGSSFTIGLPNSTLGGANWFSKPPLPTTFFADLFMMSAFLVCGFMAVQRLKGARVDGAAGLSAKPSELPKT